MIIPLQKADKMFEMADTDVTDIKERLDIASYAFDKRNRVVAISRESPSVLKSALILSGVDFIGVGYTAGYKEEKFMEVL